MKHLTPEARARKVASDNRRRKRLLAENPNLCPMCLHERPEGCLTRCCPRCGGIARAWYRKRYAKRTGPRRALKLCIICGKEAVEGHARCGYCLEANAESAARRNQRRREEGLCIQCGRPRPDEHTRCPKCRAYQKAYNQRRRKGLKQGGRILRTAQEIAA